jgi:hypothetical protein
MQGDFAPRYRAGAAPPGAPQDRRARRHEPLSQPELSDFASLSAAGGPVRAPRAVDLVRLYNY